MMTTRATAISFPTLIHRAILLTLLAALSGCNIGRMAFRLNARDAGNNSSTVGSESSAPVEATLDEKFGRKGIAAFSPSERWDLSGGMDRQNNGKVIIAAKVHNQDPKADHFDIILARVDETTGILDRTFGNNSSGFARHIFSPNNPRGGSVAALKVLSDNSIIVVGEYDHSLQGNNIFVAKFTSSGIIQWIQDAINFSSSGANHNDFATSVAIDSQNRIVVGGYSRHPSGRSRMVAVRLLPSSDLDTTFSGDGKAEVEFNLGGNSVANAVTLQTVGTAEKIVLAGFVRAGSHSNMAMARLDNAGALDVSFGAQGTVSYDASALAKDDAASSVLIVDGKILLGGYSQNGANSDMALARFDASGIEDAAFGLNGRILYNVRNSDYVTGIALVAGKILVTGYSQKGVLFEFAALRVTKAGVVEGKVTVEFPANNGVAASSYARAALPVGETGALMLGEGYFGASSQFDILMTKVKAM